MARVATDIGGTFTDLCYLDDDGVVRTSKTSTTTGKFEVGILNAIDEVPEIDAKLVNFFIHGCTVVINSLTERKGAKVGLLTTSGFRDVLEIGRSNRPDLYNLNFKKQTPYVPRNLICEVKERVDFKGEILTELEEQSVNDALDLLVAEGVECIAVCFLHSYINSKHEVRTGEIIRSRFPEMLVSLSHQISSAWREYERTSTVCLNSFVQPVAKSYLDSLEKSLCERKFSGKALHVMQSNGGATTFKNVLSKPVSMVESGPVAGVMGSKEVGSLLGMNNIISFDVGGTTAKTSCITDGNVVTTDEYRIEHDRLRAGYPILTPTVDIKEIGAGGGSIVYIDDATGVLCVGEKSAGAVPGPACYGQGGRDPTITDANLLVGRIDPHYFLGGAMKLSIELSRKAYQPLADALRLSVEDTALGVLRIADSKMVNALKLVTVQRGLDPRDYSIVAMGGGGPMHCANVAQTLGCPKIIVPEHPGVFSAFSMLMTDLRVDDVWTYVSTVSAVNSASLHKVITERENEIRNRLLDQDASESSIHISRSLSMRYSGQEHAVSVSLPSSTEIDSDVLSSAVKLFHQVHLQTYSFSLIEIDCPVEIVGIMLSGVGRCQGRTRMPELGEGERSLASSLRCWRDVWFETGKPGVSTPVYRRSSFPIDEKIIGPAIIEEEQSVTIIHPGQRCTRNKYGFLIIDTLNDAEEEKEDEDKKKRAKEEVDPFTTEIIKESLVNVGQEMFVHMTRTSMSTIIYEVLDFATGLVDCKGDLIAQGNGVAGFLGTLTFACRSVLEKYGVKGLKEGDVFISNDPYSGGGTHLSDVSVVAPIFDDEGVPIMFAANKAHWTEVGGKSPGSWCTDAKEVYEEGLQFPCIRIRDGGVLNHPLIELIEANVRTPSQSIGDFNAQLASLSIAEKRVKSLCRKYSTKTVLNAIEVLLDAGEKNAILKLNSMPKNVKFHAEDYIDDDGLGTKDIKIVCDVMFTDDNFMVVDFTGSSPPVAGPVNCGRTALEAGVRCLFQAITNPQFLPNEGSFRRLKVICPENTIATAKRPASVSTYWETMLFMADVAWQALAPSLPQHLSMGHFLSVCGTVIAGFSDDGSLFILVEPETGGWGAKVDGDGENGLVCIGDGETYMIPVEICEQRYGVRVEKFALDTSARGGAGKFRGGRGCIRKYVITSKEASVTGTYGRNVYLPWGGAGGAKGSANYMNFVHSDGKTVRKGKSAGYVLKRGEAVECVTATGGGYGNPKERDISRVIDDVRKGYISADVAIEDYGVKVNCKDWTAKRI